MQAEPLPAPLLDTPRTQQPASRRKTYLTIAAIILIVGILIFLNIYFSRLYYELYILTKNLIEANTLKTYVILTGLNVAFQMLFIPGISFFIIYIGFVTKNYLQTMAIIYPSTLAIAAMSYFLARYTIREWLYAKLHHKWYYKLYAEKSREAPLKTSWMLRVLFIPITYKNYLIALLDMDFVSFMIPAVVHYYFYFSCFAIIGVSISTLSDTFAGKIPTENKKSFYLFLSFMMLMMVASIGVIVYFTVMTVRKFKQHKRESAEQILRQQSNLILEEENAL